MSYVLVLIMPDSSQWVAGGFTSKEEAQRWTDNNRNQNPQGTIFQLTTTDLKTNESTQESL